jgi:hypothetical protein
MDIQTILENAYAIVIGIANYQNVAPLPPIVLKDAQDVYNLLMAPAYCGYSQDNVRLLLDKEASKQAILDALADLKLKADKDSTVVIYISSHGGQIQAGEYFGEFLLPIDVDASSKAALAKTSISSQEFMDALHSLASCKILVILDCCHAGGIGRPKDDSQTAIFKSGFSDSTYDALRQGNGRVILASSRSDEASWVLPGATNSLFTYHLLAGLTGGITSEDGLIRIFDLFEYLQPLVTAEQPRQHPIFRADLENNFPVALCLGRQIGTFKRPAGGYRFDVYVSYVDKDPDAVWVWETLIPRLETARLKVAVSGDVDLPGVARVVNVERGIQHAKRTLVVLSDAYLADHATDFENTLAQTLGVQEGAYRVLPIQFAPFNETRMPLRLGMLTRLDFSQPRRAERNWERLIGSLRDPLPRHKS